MYCPRCAAHTVDDAKFCRSCGADLKAVALALTGQDLPSKGGKDKAKSHKAGKSPEEKRSKGVRDTIEGAILLAGSLLICLAINLLSNHIAWSPRAIVETPGLSVGAIRSAI